MTLRDAVRPLLPGIVCGHLSLSDALGQMAASTGVSVEQLSASGHSGSAKAIKQLKIAVALERGGAPTKGQRRAAANRERALAIRAGKLASADGGLH